MTGFAAIGLYNPKSPENVGGAMRACSVYGANLIAISGEREKRVIGYRTDTAKAWKHIPTIVTENIFDATPYETITVAVEFIKTAKPLPNFTHPERAYYIFGPEDGSIPPEVISRCKYTVFIPTDHCMNLASTVNVVLYDRLAKGDIFMRNEKEHYK